MKHIYKHVFCLSLVLLLSSCAGVRHSYESLLDADASVATIVLEVGETREVLAIGDGFPGWWGFYPAVITSDDGIASIHCKPGRSFIPFREPGITFGGERCYLTTNKPGDTWLLTGGKFTIKDDLENAVSKGFKGAPLSEQTYESRRVIKLKVLPGSND